MLQKNCIYGHRSIINIILIAVLSNLISVSGQEIQNIDVILLPSGTEGAAPFGAYYSKLLYEPEWDKLWPVSDVADVVVRFDNKEPRFVFWRGTS